MNKLDLFR